LKDEETGPSLAEQFRRFAVGVARDDAPRYARICAGIADDAELLSLAAEAPSDQRRPNILLAAVHYLLLSGVDHPLARHYPTVEAWRGLSGGVPDDDDPFPDFAAFCRRHRPEIARLVATRATQTNEVGRCRALLPALAAVAARSGEPLGLVDLGAAAGLNLLFDRYFYDYGPAGVAGDPLSPVVLDCELRGGLLPPLGTPRVGGRIGVDRRPVDVRDDDSALWLLACQWPDHLDRFSITQLAVEVARVAERPPVVVAGDMVADLERVVDALPADVHVCLFHSWVAAYLTPGEQESLVAAVARVAEQRPTSWLYAEAPYEVPALPMPPPPADDVKGATALVLVEPGRTPELGAVRLADMHSHGRWLVWYGADR
jgi:hypothetical protein